MRALHPRNEIHQHGRRNAPDFVALPIQRKDRVLMAVLFEDPGLITFASSTMDNGTVNTSATSRSSGTQLTGGVTSATTGSTR